MSSSRTVKSIARSEATEKGPSPALVAMAMSMWTSPQMRFANNPTVVLSWNDEGKGGATGTCCPDGCARNAPFWLVWSEPGTGKTKRAIDIFDAGQLQWVIDRYGLKLNSVDVPRAVIAALALNPDDSAVQLLLDGGVDVDTRDERSGQTALHATDISRRVEQLVRAGADVNARDTEGNTPLHIAAARIPERAMPLVSALLAAGADPRACSGTTPAAVASTVRVAEILREARERA